MARIFISYSRKDFPTVDRLRHDLRDAGIDIWIDQVGLTPGTLSWEQALRDAIIFAHWPKTSYGRKTHCFHQL